MTNPIIERAARALYGEPQLTFIRNCVDPKSPPRVRVRPPRGAAWQDAGPKVQTAFCDQARAVLRAIREPGVAMVGAGGEQVLDTEFGAGQYESIADGRGSKLTANEQGDCAVNYIIATNRQLRRGKPWWWVSLNLGVERIACGAHFAERVKEFG